MTGASTIQPNDMRSILLSFVFPFHDYEAHCWLKNIRNKMQYEILDRYWRKRGFLLNPLMYLIFAMRALEIPDRVFETHHLKRLLGFIISMYLERLDHRNYSLPSLDPSGQLFVLCAVTIAGTMYRVSGRRSEAITLLETIIHIVEQDLDLRNAIIWFFYNEMLIELAHCCAEDGHRDEARHLLNKQLKMRPSSEETIADTRLCLHFRDIYDIILERRLRKGREKALRLVGQLDNGHTNTRLQEGSCLQGTSEWGPFLTDCIEWDKI